MNKDLEFYILNSDLLPLIPEYIEKSHIIWRIGLALKDGIREKNGLNLPETRADLVNSICFSN
jgi:hypothetical protein